MSSGELMTAAMIDRARHLSRLENDDKTSASAALAAVLDHLDLVTGERDQYRRDFIAMSDFNAKLTMRLKMQGCSDADIDAARIVPPIAPVIERPARRLIGSDEDRARTDERIMQWMAKHGEDADIAADLQAAVTQAGTYKQQLRALATLSLAMLEESDRAFERGAPERGVPKQQE